MKKHSNPQVILSIVVGLLVLFAIFKLNWLLWASLIIGIIGLLSDTIASLISKVWLKFAEILGKVNGTILLSIVFFIFLTPIAILMRIVSKADALRLKKPSGSNYVEKNHKYVGKDLENIW